MVAETMPQDLLQSYIPNHLGHGSGGLRVDGTASDQHYAVLPRLDLGENTHSAILGGLAVPILARAPIIVNDLHI